MTLIAADKTFTPQIFSSRCSCFDSDCRDLDHFRCFSGDPSVEPVDGYCPYLLGTPVTEGQTK